MPHSADISIHIKQKKDEVVSLYDGKCSNPTYVLNIDIIDKKSICAGSNEPEFSSEKNINLKM